MKSNNRISLSAEMAALIRAEKNVDKFSKYFTTPRAKKWYSITKKIAPKKLESIFNKRSSLAIEIKNQIKKFHPSQLIEIASGLSMTSFEYAYQNPNCLSIETDLPGIINAKSDIINHIQTQEKLKPLNNHIIIPLNILDPNSLQDLIHYTKKHNKTLIFAEGLTSYFDKKQYEQFIMNIKKILKKTGGVFLCHETLNEKITSGFSGSLIRKAVSVLTHSKAHQHFHSKEELLSWYLSQGFKEVAHHEGKSGSYLFTMKLKV